jgi:diketogulonate reductase-like aldo/keto reductase
VLCRSLALTLGLSKLSRADLWKQMEDCKAQGLAKAIGVSNYRERHLDDTLAAAKEPIAANQIELHPCTSIRWRLRV